MVKPETIASAANPLLKDVRRAIARGGLTDEGWCVAETFHLLEEALRSRLRGRDGAGGGIGCSRSAAASAAIKRVAVLPDDAAADRFGHGGEPGSDRTGRSRREWKLEQLFRGTVAGGGARWVAGSRQCRRDCARGGGVRRDRCDFLKGTVSPYNPKTLRASAGSMFRVPLLYGLDRGAGRGGLRTERGRAVRRSAVQPANCGTWPSADFTAACAIDRRQRRARRQREAAGEATDVSDSDGGRGIVERGGGRRDSVVRGAPPERRQRR